MKADAVLIVTSFRRVKVSQFEIKIFFCPSATFLISYGVFCISPAATLFLIRSWHSLPQLPSSQAGSWEKTRIIIKTFPATKVAKSATVSIWFFTFEIASCLSVKQLEVHKADAQHVPKPVLQIKIAMIAKYRLRYVLVSTRYTGFANNNPLLLLFKCGKAHWL